MTQIISFPKLGLEFNIHTTAFTIGSFAIQWYGVLIGIGFLLAIMYSFASVKKMNIDDDKMLDTIIGGIIGGVVGARAYFLIFYNGDYFTGDTLKENLYQMIDIHSGGLGFYGGFIGALLVGWIVAKLRKMNVASLFDQVALGFLIGQGIGRWGNFVNQEAFGAPTDLPWGMVSANTGFVPVHPCFLYESIACLLGFVILHIFTRKWRHYDGQTFFIYIGYYGLVRFFVEQLRTDSLVVGPFRVSVVVAALMMIFSLAGLIICRKRTSLTGYGSKNIMELNGVVFGSVQREKEEAKEREEDMNQAHTILGDDAKVNRGSETAKHNKNMDGKGIVDQKDDASAQSEQDKTPAKESEEG